MNKVKVFLKKIPILRELFSILYALASKVTFSSSQEYWEKRYVNGGNSGAGSYGRLAEFKAKIINDFVAEKTVSRVVELGCGDGNQLSLANYPEYIGLDVSPQAIKICLDKFQKDTSKSFFAYYPEAIGDNLGLFSGDLSLSLDVIYHLVEDEVYYSYLDLLFSVSNQWVIIYSSSSANVSMVAHVKHREVVGDVGKKFPEWKLIDTIVNPNEYRKSDEQNTSFADFYIFERRS